MNLKQHFYFYKENRIPGVEHIVSSENNGLIMVSLAWGLKDPVANYHQKISDYFTAAKEDNEATAPFAKYLQYPTNLNNLQIAMQLENENILREFNSEEYTTGIESFIAYKEGNELGWASYGGLSLFLCKENSSIQLLQSSSNWATDQEGIRACLPKKYLGVNSKIDISMDLIHLDDKDRIFLFYSSKINLMELSPDIDNLEKFVNFLSTKSPKQAYWVAEVNF